MRKSISESQAVLASRRWRVAMIQDAPREFDLRTGRMPSRRNPARYSSRVTRPSPSASYSSTTSNVGASPLPMVRCCLGAALCYGYRRGSLRADHSNDLAWCVAGFCSVQAQDARASQFVPESALQPSPRPSSRARWGGGRAPRRCSYARARLRLLYGFFGRMQASGR